MIVLDGRNDREKLSELLAAGEQTHLDYKETLDLSETKHKLSIVKDLVTLSNRPGGGYLVIGVRDDGTPCIPIGTFGRSRFDGAALGQLVRGYIEAQIHLNSQVFELDDGNEVIVIQVQGHSDGLPVPLAKLGQYPDAATGKPVVMFREGDLLIREGSGNVPLRHAHWADILKERERLIRAQALENSQDLIREVVDQMRAGGGGTASSAPLVLGMDPISFAKAVIINFEAGSRLRIKQFLHHARHMAISPATELETVSEALDRVAELAALAIFYDRPDEARDAIDALYETYLHLASKAASAHQLTDILARVYALGSLAVRLRQWPMVNYLTNKPVSVPSGSSYVYSSWLRHGQVQGSRNKVFPEGNGGLLISMARDLMATHSALRPDVPDETVAPAENLDREDVLLNSLCQFDLAYCLITAAEGEGQAKGYPTFAAFHQTRSDSLLELIARDPGARAGLFPESPDGVIGQSMMDVVSMAAKESWNFGNFGTFWSGLPPAAERFVSSQGLGTRDQGLGTQASDPLGR